MLIGSGSYQNSLKLQCVNMRNKRVCGHINWDHWHYSDWLMSVVWITWKAHRFCRNKNTKILIHIHNTYNLKKYVNITLILLNTPRIVFFTSWNKVASLKHHNGHGKLLYHITIWNSKSILNLVFLLQDFPILGYLAMTLI